MKVNLKTRMTMPSFTCGGMSSFFADDRIQTARIGQDEKMKNNQTWVRAGDHLKGIPAPQEPRPQEDAIEN